MGKKIWVYVLLLFCFFSCTGEQKAVISGESELFTVEDTLYFSNRALEDFPLPQLFVYKAVVDSSKHFKIEIPLKKPGFISLSSGLTFYTMPKDSVDLVISEGPNVKYKGKYASLNNALADFKIGYRNLIGPIFQKYIVPQTDQLTYRSEIIQDIESVLLKKREHWYSRYYSIFFISVTSKDL